MIKYRRTSEFKTKRGKKVVKKFLQIYESFEISLKKYQSFSKKCKLNMNYTYEKFVYSTEISLLKLKRKALSPLS